MAKSSFCEMESSSEIVHCLIISSYSMDRQKYFSARTHIDWQSSKVILVNKSTSNGPANRLFSSLIKTAKPSHLLSAGTKWTFKEGKHRRRFVYHSNMCFLNNPKWRHLLVIPGEFCAWICLTCTFSLLNRKKRIDRRNWIRSDIYPRSRFGSWLSFLLNRPLEVSVSFWDDVQKHIFDLDTRDLVY